MSSRRDAALAERFDDEAGDPRASRTVSREQLDAMVVEMVQHHAEGLLRLARRHSLCPDDAHDAYQRGFEIFLRHAPRLDPERAPAWLRTVVKHEAMAVRRARQRDLGPAELEADAIEARNSPSPEERAVGAEHVERSAEALRGCKPQEVRALWLRAQGNTYDEIQEITGWTRTKVNRCIYEGRQAFLARYAGIESGAECRRWAPMLSALVDGEATTSELLELRPHLRNCPSCRAALRELHRAKGPLAVVFPAAVVTVAADHVEPAGQVFVRVYESVSNWLAERATSSLVRAQVLVEGVAGSATKATAVAATAATVAGGGAVAIDHASRAADARPAAASTVRTLEARKPPVAPRARPSTEQAATRGAANQHAGRGGPEPTGGKSRRAARDEKAKRKPEPVSSKPAGGLAGGSVPSAQSPPAQAQPAAVVAGGTEFGLE